MSNIRVTYAGLIAFVISLASVVTGMLFIIIVTRTLSAEEYGTWALMGSLISYFLISQGMINFWALRQVARGEEVGRTSVISSWLFSLGVIPFYIILSSVLSEQSNAQFDSMLLGAILIPLQFVSQSLNGVNLGHRPQATSYSLIIFESTKIPAALALVYFLKLGLDGAIIAIAIAFSVKIIIQLYFAAPKIRDKFKIETLRRWVRLSWVSLYSAIPQLISSLDIMIYPIITGSVIGVAFFSASFAIASIVLHIGMISQALYPKLLATGSQKNVLENFSLLMYFGIPLLGLAVIFAKPGLYILNPIYQDASLVVILLSFRTFFFVLSQTMQKVIMAFEGVDIEDRPSFYKLVKSKLFFVSTINYVKSGLYIGILIIILVNLHSTSLSELELVTMWAYVVVFIEIPFFVFMLVLVQKTVKFSFPYMNTLKYALTTILFGIVYFYTSDLLIVYEERIFDFIPGFVVQLAICVGLYLSITYATDRRTRVLFSSIIHEIIKKK